MELHIAKQSDIAEAQNEHWIIKRR
jgi:hypothetical protein